VGEASGGLSYSSGTEEGVSFQGWVRSGPFGVEAPVLIVAKLDLDPLVDGRKRVMEDGDHRHDATRSCAEVCGLCECGLKMVCGAWRAIFRGDFSRGSLGTRLSL